MPRSCPHLRIAEEDSLLRGYRFSPTKCVIVSSLAYQQRLYDAELPRHRTFCYLGIDLCVSGIDLGSHTSARIQKAEKATERLRVAEARFNNFPSFVNIQLYAAFIRPGLEYGIQLTSHHKASLYRLQQCQKSIVCSFLGVHINAWNDVIEAISYCPQMFIRSLMLRTRRAQKLSALWASESRLEYALLYVLDCLQGPELTFDQYINLAKTHEEIPIELFIGPVTASLSNRFDGSFALGLRPV